MPGAPALLSYGSVSRLLYCISLLPSELSQGPHEPLSVPRLCHLPSCYKFCILLSGAPMMLGILLLLAFTHTQRDQSVGPSAPNTFPSTCHLSGHSLLGLSFRACLLGWTPGTQFTLLGSQARTVIPILHQEPPASCLLLWLF